MIVSWMFSEITPSFLTSFDFSTDLI